METINNKVGQKIRTLRLLQNLTQEKVALTAGMWTSQLGAIERGEKNPTLETLARIADALNVDVKDLFDDSGQLSECAQEGSNQYV